MGYTKEFKQNEESERMRNEKNGLFSLVCPEMTTTTTTTTDTRYFAIRVILYLFSRRVRFIVGFCQSVFL